MATATLYSETSDGYAQSGGSFFNIDDDVKIGYHPLNGEVGSFFVFNSSLLAADTISAATLELSAYIGASDQIRMTIFGKKLATPNPPTSKAQYLARINSDRTTATVDWDISANTSQFDDSVSPDISAILSEIQAVDSWGGNFEIWVVTRVTSGLSRSFFSREGADDYGAYSSVYSPTLNITYTSSGGGGGGLPLHLRYNMSGSGPQNIIQKKL